MLDRWYALPQIAHVYCWQLNVYDKKRRSPQDNSRTGLTYQNVVTPSSSVFKLERQAQVSLIMELSAE